MRLDEDNRVAATEYMSYKEHARSMLNMLLSNSLNQRPAVWKDRSDAQKMCRQCVDDNTLNDDDARTKIWLDTAHLKRHQESSFHAPQQQ